MKILLCPDKFKGTFTAPQVVKRLQKSLQKHFPSATLDPCPVADGGDGFAQAMATAWGAELEWHKVRGPLQKKVRAPLVWKLEADGSRSDTVCLGMADSAGLALCPPDELDPWMANTHGFGQLLKIAVAQGARTILLGIGGSATTEAGMGLAFAAGATLDAETGVLSTPAWFREVEVIVACDVQNPVFGKQGCVRVFGPQKGIAAEDFEKYDDRLQTWVDLVHASFPETKGMERAPGSGAAGGIGFTLRALFRAELRSGLKILAEEIQLEERIRAADLIITGEGGFDASSLQGKVVGQILKLANNAKKPVIIACGRSDLPTKAMPKGIHSLHEARAFPDKPEKKQLKAACKAAALSAASVKVVKPVRAAKRSRRPAARK